MYIRFFQDPRVQKNLREIDAYAHRSRDARCATPPYYYLNGKQT